MVVGETFIELPEPKAVPPQLPLYQNQLFAELRLPEAMLSEVEVPLHKVDSLALRVGVVGTWFTVTVIFAQLPEVTQPPSPLT